MKKRKKKKNPKSIHQLVKKNQNETRFLSDQERFAATARMLEKLMPVVPDKQKIFLYSIANFFEQRGYLSARQQAVLIDIYNKVNPK